VPPAPASRGHRRVRAGGRGAALVAKGLSYRQIADRLSLSHRTVQNHVQNTLGMLRLHNRVELVRCALKHGLDDPAD
jgi:DNA-binding NarL/FixJ family response regulator